MMSTLFRLDLRDATKGVAIAVITAVLVWLLQALNTPGFDFGSIDYAEVGRMAFAAGLAYIVKNFLTDEQGLLLGKI